MKVHPIRDFFANYPDFEYNSKAPFLSEFKRMGKDLGWKTKEREAAMDDLRDAMVKQFNAMYGTRVDALESWRLLCSALGMNPAPKDIKNCHRVSGSDLDRLCTKGSVESNFGACQPGRSHRGATFGAVCPDVRLGDRAERIHETFEEVFPPEQREHGKPSAILAPPDQETAPSPPPWRWEVSPEGHCREGDNTADVMELWRQDIHTSVYRRRYVRPCVACTALYGMGFMSYSFARYRQ